MSAKLNTNLFVILLAGIGAIVITGTMAPLISVDSTDIGSFNLEDVQPMCECLNVDDPNFDPDNPATHDWGPQYCHVDEEGNVHGDENMICTWEYHGPYGTANTLEGCSAEFWESSGDPFLDSYVWPAGYDPDYKFNNAFGTNLVLYVTDESYHLTDELCHLPPGNNDNAQTIDISINAIPAHIEHGDYFGTCTDENNIEIFGNELDDESPDEKKKRLDELKTNVIESVDELKSSSKLSKNDLKEKLDELIDKFEGTPIIYKNEMKNKIQELLDDYKVNSVKFKNELKLKLKEQIDEIMSKSNDLRLIEYYKDPTLMDVLKLRTGDANPYYPLDNLAAESVAALLNGVHDEVHFKHNVKKIIDMTSDSILDEQYSTTITDFRLNNNIGDNLLCN